jgi:gamma-glutamyltranspeptidase/glutathione hydrolase
LLTEEDFRAYHPQIVDALRITCRELELCTPPPPSGGITSLGFVQTVEQFGLQATEPWGGHYFHVLAEILKLCWQERYQYLGDPDFVNIPIDQLLSEQAANERAGRLKGDEGTLRASGSRHPAPRSDSPHTANACAADAEGNLISITATQGWMYGSHLVVDGLGLVLNHGMSRFDYSPGHPNRPAFAIGMPGGPKIVSVTAQLALNLMSLGATPSESIAVPRLHTDGGEPLLVSTHMTTSVVDELERRGHAVRREADMGGPVNVLVVDRQQGVIDAAAGEGTGAVAGF